MMKKTRLLLVAVLALLVVGVLPLSAAKNMKLNNRNYTQPVWEVNTTPQDVEYMPGKLMIKFKSDVSSALYRQGVSGPSVGIPTIDAKMNKWNVQKIDKAFPNKTAPVDASHTDLSRIYEIQFSADRNVVDLAQDFSSDPAVEYAEPVFIRYTQVEPNDPNYSQQFHWDIVKMEEAWDLSQGSSDIVIGIIDTGVDWNHEDLADHIWENMGEDANGDGMITAADINNVDDDNNGYIDDFRGWDFVDVPANYDEDNQPADGEDGTVPDNDPTDFDGHGSHVAGISSAVTNNEIGVAGAGWGCSIMALKAGYQNQGGNGSIGWGYPAIVYAVDNGANILNLSWGGGGYSQFEQDVMDYAWQHDVLVITSAGNDDTDQLPYPSGYDHVVNVAATIHDIDIKSSFSNYGEWVDICAPGTTIYSTLPGDRYGYLSGTSQACPVVVGIAGLVWANNPGWSSDRVALQLLETADPVDDRNPDFQGLLGSGRVNAYRALTESPSSVQVESYSFTDPTGNNDGILDIGETINIFVELKSYLDNVSNVSISMSTENEYVTLSNSTVSYGSIMKDQIVTNTSSPFVMTASSDAPIGEYVSLKLDITGNDGAYKKTKFINVTIQPLYNNHNINNVDFTVTSFGIFGYNDYAETGQQFGTGFQYPKGTESALYMGAFCVAAAPDQVSDCAYGNATYDHYDWITSDGGNLRMGSADVSDQDGVAMFNDSRAENPIGLDVVQKSYAWNNPTDEDYVIVEYTLMNNTSETMEDLYAGLFMDWDIDIAVDNLNTVGYDAETSLGYMTSSGANYYGISVLYPEIASYRAIDHSQYLYDNALTDALKYQFMTEGMVVTASDYAFDWSNLISAGPFTLEPGELQVVSFAVLGGDDLADIKANAQAAHTKYNVLAPSSIVINHSPLKDTEDVANPYVVTADLTNSEGQVVSADLYWKTEGDEEFSVVSMSAAIEDAWTANIPAQSEKQVQYYIKATDEVGRSSLSPNTAPVQSYGFYAGADDEAPVISEMTEILDTFNAEGPFTVTATITDNLGVDDATVVVDYQLNEEEPQQVAMTANGDETYTADMSFSRDLTSGDQISYTVTAKDLSASANSVTSEPVAFSIVSTLLVDDFESELTKWDLGSVWETNFFSHQGNNSLTDSPLGFYEPNSQSVLTLADGYDFSARSEITVSFYMIYILSDGDALYFEASRDGTNWQTLKTYTGESGYSWIEEQVSLNDYVGAGNENVQFRFNLVADGDNNVGDGVYLDDIYILADGVNAIDSQEESVPTEYSLMQNYPNPFNPVTTVAYELPKAGQVSIEIYSILGERIATLVDREHQAGRYKVVWNALNDNGVKVSSGVYFYKIKTESFVNVKKMILIK